MFTLTFTDTMGLMGFCRWFDGQIGTDREIDPGTHTDPTAVVSIFDIRTDTMADRIIAEARKHGGKTASELV